MVAPVGLEPTLPLGKGIFLSLHISEGYKKSPAYYQFRHGARKWWALSDLNRRVTTYEVAALPNQPRAR